AIPFAWQLFEFEWVVPAKTGRYSLMARATDQNGKTQPMEHDLDRRTYMVNFISPIDVDVI
ncbi:MAG: sulfite oxidase, partial [Pedobacter sp.]|nr:sulfite oxidase [Pedobacter sp.]